MVLCEKEDDKYHNCANGDQLKHGRISFEHLFAFKYEGQGGVGADSMLFFRNCLSFWQCDVGHFVRSRGIYTPYPQKSQNPCICTPFGLDATLGTSIMTLTMVTLIRMARALRPFTS